MRKTWVITILTVLLFSGRVFAGDSVRSDTAGGWLSDAPKMVTMTDTDTQLKQKALAEVTLTDTWLQRNGYTREMKEEVMRKTPVYEKKGLYYWRKNNRFVYSENIKWIESGIEMGMRKIKRQRGSTTAGQ